MGEAAIGAPKRVCGVRKVERRASPPSADALAARNHTQEWKKEGGKGGKRGDGTGTTTYPNRHPPNHQGLPTRNTTGTCVSDDIQILHADDVNGGESGVGSRGAGDTSSVRNLDIDKVGAADSRTGFVAVMVIIVIERIKLFKTRGSVRGRR